MAFWGRAFDSDVRGHLYGRRAQTQTASQSTVPRRWSQSGGRERGVGLQKSDSSLWARRAISAAAQSSASGEMADASSDLGDLRSLVSETEVRSVPSLSEFLARLPVPGCVLGSRSWSWVHQRITGTAWGKGTGCYFTQGHKGCLQQSGDIWAET